MSSPTLQTHTASWFYYYDVKLNNKLAYGPDTTDEDEERVDEENNKTISGHCNSVQQKRLRSENTNVYFQDP